MRQKYILKVELEFKYQNHGMGFDDIRNLFARLHQGINDYTVTLKDREIISQLEVIGIEEKD